MAEREQARAARLDELDLPGHVELPGQDRVGGIGGVHDPERIDPLGGDHVDPVAVEAGGGEGLRNDDVEPAERRRLPGRGRRPGAKRRPAVPPVLQHGAEDAGRRVVVESPPIGDAPGDLQAGPDAQGPARIGDVDEGDAGDLSGRAPPGLGQRDSTVGDVGVGVPARGRELDPGHGPRGPRVGEVEAGDEGQVAHRSGRRGDRASRKRKEVLPGGTAGDDVEDVADQARVGHRTLDVETREDDGLGRPRDVDGPDLGARGGTDGACVGRPEPREGVPHREEGDAAADVEVDGLTGHRDPGAEHRRRRAGEVDDPEPAVAVQDVEGGADERVDVRLLDGASGGRAPGGAGGGARGGQAGVGAARGAWAAPGGRGEALRAWRVELTGRGAARAGRQGESGGERAGEAAHGLHRSTMRGRVQPPARPTGPGRPSGLPTSPAAAVPQHRVDVGRQLLLATREGLGLAAAGRIALLAIELERHPPVDARPEAEPTTALDGGPLGPQPERGVVVEPPFSSGKPPPTMTRFTCS